MYDFKIVCFFVPLNFLSKVNCFVNMPRNQILQAGSKRGISPFSKPKPKNKCQKLKKSQLQNPIPPCTAQQCSMRIWPILFQQFSQPEEVAKIISVIKSIHASTDPSSKCLVTSLRVAPFWYRYGIMDVPCPSQRVRWECSSY